jgi:plastocyanin
MRFPGLGIPSGAKITNAYLQFAAAQVQTGPMMLTLRAQNADTAPPLTNTRWSLSSRAATTARATWDVAPWVAVNESGSAERSPDLTAVVQEVVNRTGWTTSSALALLVSGSGSGIRVARSYDGAPLQAPLLHVEYDSGTLVDSAPTVSIDQPVANSTVNRGDTVTFAATAWDNQDGDVGPSVVWTSDIDGQIGTGARIDVSTLSQGTHTIVATATDKAGATASASRTIKVFAPVPVLVGAGDIADCGEQGDEATAKLLDATPGTVFTVGDNVYPDGTADQFKNCYDPTWGRHKLRTRPTAGNHDYHVAGAGAYFDYFGEAAGPSGLGYYSYDVAGWHIIALNSQISSSAGSVQEQWLRADLAAHPAVCTAAIFHYPRFSSGVQHGSNPGMQPFWQALYDYGADVVLNGHEHDYERFAPQTPTGVADSARGIREFVIGTGGAAESGYTFGTPLPNSEVRATDAFGLLKLTLSPTGYDWTFLAAPGTTFTDSGHGDCVGADASVNAAPVVDAGPDQIVTLPGDATLAGTVQDDGLPAGSTVSSTWTKVDGPGTVTFADASKPATQASFSAAGSYRLRLTADDGALSSSDVVTVTVNPAGAANTAPAVDAGPDQTVTMPAAASLAGVATDDGLPSGSSLSVQWSKVSGPGAVTFANPTDASTTATFETAGSYVLRLTATDGDLSSSDTTTVTVAAPSGGGGTPVTVQAVVAAASDDAEERSGSSVDLGSTDLELVTDGSVVQTVGVRFPGLAVPRGAQVTAASIQFQDDEVSTDATSLTIRGQAADDAATFTSSTANVSGRPRTSASTAWVPAAWNTIGERGAAQRTPDLSAVVQEVVNRSGWASGHAMAFVITGSGRRTAESFEGGAPAVLQVTYVAGGSGGGPANTAPTVDAGPDQTVTMPAAASLAGVATDDGLPSGSSLSVQWSKVSGPGAVTFANPTDASTTATFDTAGSYVLRLTATDGDLSSSDTTTVTVAATGGGGGGGGGGGTTVTVEAPVAANSDDAEERSGGVDLGSTDLELVTDGSVVQTVGMRFAALAVPAGALIDKAWIQFSTDEVTTGATSLNIRAQAADDAATFSATTGNVSSRPRTTASTSWVPLAWTTLNERGTAQQTPDLSAVLQEVVSRPGWKSGNATAFVVTGTGTRTAISHEKSAKAAPLLHVEYRMP